ncbi:MAG: hypothetical protein ACLTE2_11300 [Eubacteriales bacterium]
MAAQAGLNIKVTGAYNSSAATAKESQDYAAGEQTKPGNSVITVNFVEEDTVRWHPAYNREGAHSFMERNNTQNSSQCPNMQ